MPLGEVDLKSRYGSGVNRAVLDKYIWGGLCALPPVIRLPELQKKGDCAYRGNEEKTEHENWRFCLF